MKPTEINQAIAECLGWTQVRCSDSGSDVMCAGLPPGVPPEKLMGRRITPRFTTDLNAMHDAEKTLTDKEYDLFEQKVYDYAADALPVDIVGGIKMSRGFIRAVSVTAAQRAEAFLRTVGRWVDGD